MVKTEKMAKMDVMDVMGRKEIEDPEVKKAKKDVREREVLMVNADRLVQPVHKVLMDIMDASVHKDLLDQPAHKDFKDGRVRKDHKDQQDHKEFKVQQDHKDFKDRQVSKGLKDGRAQKVIQVLYLHHSFHQYNKKYTVQVLHGMTWKH
jgi:hypothetical protein